MYELLLPAQSVHMWVSLFPDNQLRFAAWWCQRHHRERRDDHKLPTYSEGSAFGLRSLSM